jgi:competence protein ComEA
MLGLLGLFVAVNLLAVAPAAAQGAQPAKAVDARPVVVNLNAATATELEVLPGVGAKTALRIVEYRQKNGPFKKIEELMNVQGIGEKTFLKLKPQLSVASKPEPSPAAAAPQQP